MSIDYTSTANIASVKRRALIPNSQQLYSDEEICSVLSEELHMEIVPMIMSVREDYMVHDYDQSISSSVRAYEIPGRAIGNKLRDVVLVNADDQEVSLERISPDLIKRQMVYGVSDIRGFFFKDDQVILHPDASGLGDFDLRMKYFRRPNKVVVTSECAQVSQINSGTGVITFTSMPSDWVATMTFDFIKGTPSFRSREDDVAPSVVDVSAKTMTVSAIPTGLAVGDWAGQAGTSPIVQLPWELHSLLDQRAVVKLLEGMGDSDGHDAADKEYEKMKTNFKLLVTPRADGSGKKVVSTSPLFGGRRARGPWF